jgi:hypothetical protein
VWVFLFVFLFGSTGIKSRASGMLD